VVKSACSNISIIPVFHISSNGRIIRIRDSSGNIATRIRTGRLRNQSVIPGRERNFFHNFQAGTGIYTASYPTGIGGPITDG
jgi:hypothetical protein